jgi:hypothetical protein
VVLVLVSSRFGFHRDEMHFALAGRQPGILGSDPPDHDPAR